MENKSSQRWMIWIALVLLAVTVSVYWPIKTHQFINYDDQDYITENQVVAQGWTSRGVSWAFSTGHAGNWHPLTWLSHMLDCELHGMNAGGHHFTNLLLHCANSVLLLLALHCLTGSVWRSGFVAALFAWHPMHVESVAWASERKDVLSGFFFMLTLWAYAKYAQSRAPGSNKTSRAPYFFYVLGLLLFACGLMSKPMLVTMPFVLLLLDYWPLRRMRWEAPGISPKLKNLWPLALEKIPFFMLSVASSVVTFIVQRRTGTVAGFTTMPLDMRLENACIAYFAYIRKMIWPTNLAPFYPIPAERAAFVALLSAVMLVGITVLALRWGSKRPYLVTGWLWYLGTLVPVIGLVQVGAQSMADRYSYLPFIGLFIIIAWTIPGPLANRQWEWGIKVAAVAAILGCLVLTQAQVRRWKDSKTLFTYATQVTAGSFIGHHNLGAVLVEEGQIEQGAYHFAEAVRINSKYAESHSDLGLACVLLGRVDEGIEHYRAALALKPNLDKTHYNLGSALATQGKQAEALKEYAAAVQLNAHYPEARRALALALAHAGQTEPAIPHFEQYLRLRPNDLDIHFDFARVLNSVGRKGEAADHLRQVLRLKADDAEAHERLGLILAETGQVQEAIGHFGEAARLQPTAQVRYELALALSIAGQRKQAIEQYRQALELKPDWPAALNDLAWILATDREAENRQGTEAVRLAERACELAGGKEARFWGTLDAAYAEAGRFEDAIRAANRARELAAANGQAEVAEAAGKRLELYHGRKPFRQ